MLTINTNLSSLIAQTSMKTSTNKLNQSIERMTTGFKINHAKDNAANYAISTSMTTKINSLMVAEDNAAMGLDMVTTAEENLSLIQSHLTRLRDLQEQASNGTYGEESLKAINAEANALVDEIERLYKTAEFNGQKVLDGQEYDLPDFAQKKYGNFLIEPIKEVTEGYEVKTLSEAYAEGIFDPNIKYSISNSDELKKLAKMVNNSVSTAGVTFFLENDIDMSGVDDWDRIGASSVVFEGVFNGNGYAIKNLEGTGLFYYIARGAEVKNVGVENFELNNAAITGANNGIVDNCYVVNGTVTSPSNVGAIVADNYNIVKNCYVDADIKSLSWAGGIAGYSCGVTTFSNNYSKGTVTGRGYVGGLVGLVNVLGANLVLKDCATSSQVSVMSGAAGSLLGGITVTRNGLSISGTELKKCYCAEQNLSLIGRGVDYNSTTVTYTDLPDYDLSSLSSGIRTLTKQRTEVDFQVGTESNDVSRINYKIAFDFDYTQLRQGFDLELIDSLLKVVRDKQVENGAVLNRLESVLDEIAIKRDNLISSRSTIQDADIAETSSTYIQQQILQQASATLLATANQSPSIALQLI